MSAVEEPATPSGETPIYATGLHPMAYFLPVIGIAFALALFLAGLGENVNIFAYFIALTSIATILTRRKFKVEVYKDRVRIRRPWTTTDVLRSQIEMVDYIRPALAFGDYGNVTLRGTGVDRAVLKLIPRPEHLRDLILERDGEEKTCPQCAEKVRQAALACRYCGYKFGE